jgi:ABC-type dipeptide/oligopeptide/nickel transport system permease component
MEERITRKSLDANVILSILVSMNFVLFRVLAPYDQSDLISSGLHPVVEEGLSRQFGSPQPLYIRYFEYITDMFTSTLAALSLQCARDGRFMEAPSLYSFTFCTSIYLHNYG